MFSEFLMEGKEPPIIEEIGESVTVTLRKSDLNAAFRFFVQDELEKGNSFDVDSLLLLQKLFSQPSIDLKQAAKLCQRSEDYIGDKLVAMDGSGYLSQMGTSSKPQWIFSEELRDRFAISNGSGKLSKENWNAAKAAVLEELVERAENGQEGLSNSDIRKMTSLDRNQVFRMMTELREANPEISVPEKGRSARYSINAHINAG
jgi:ATP-dependent DNA helicase RecG